MEKKKILIVEDEGVIAISTKIALMGRGYEVLPIAISGRTALELAEAHKPDMVLMDIRLRGPIDGIETVRQMNQGKAAAPVIYITAHSDESVMLRARETNPSAILHKPVDEETLDAAIRKALNLH